MTELFKALGGLSRLRILALVMDRPRSASGLMDLLELDQSTVSRQLGILRDVGLLEILREGRTARYRIREDFLREHAKLAAYLEERFAGEAIFRADRLKACKDPTLK